MADLDTELQPFAQSLLGSGEELLGACIASQQKRFSGFMVTIAVARDRLLIQRMAKGSEFIGEGEPLSLRAEDIAGVRAGNAGTWGAMPTAEIMAKATVELKIRTTAGDKMRLMMMRGVGKPFDTLGGGEIQRAGVEALGGWFDRQFPPR